MAYSVVKDLLKSNVGSSSSNYSIGSYSSWNISKCIVGMSYYSINGGVKVYASNTNTGNTQELFSFSNSGHQHAVKHKNNINNLPYLNIFTYYQSELRLILSIKTNSIPDADTDYTYYHFDFDLEMNGSTSIFLRNFIIYTSKSYTEYNWNDVYAPITTQGDLNRFPDMANIVFAETGTRTKAYCPVYRSFTDNQQVTHYGVNFYPNIFRDDIYFANLVSNPTQTYQIGQAVRYADLDGTYSTYQRFL